MGVISDGTTMLDAGAFENLPVTNWDTTVKTANFTAVAGNGYFCNTSGGAFTLTLPASPSAGDIVGLKDYSGTFATNNLTLDRNGSNLDGNAGNKVVDTDYQNLTLIYVDGTKGWTPIGSGAFNIGLLPSFVAATGGTITCCGDYRIHTFTSPGTFTVTSLGNPVGGPSTVDYLVAAGGGGGGGASGWGNAGASGGGAGGYRESSGADSGCYSISPLGSGVPSLPVSITGYPITVGGGGSGGASINPGSQGSNSIFSTITSAGGGFGSSQNAANPGGSGGGGSWCTARFGGTGNQPPVSPPQGNPGGDGRQPSPFVNGGGGGATAAGQPYQPSNGIGASGAGATSCITGSPLGRSGGGGSGGGNSTGPGTSGSCGAGHGGNNGLPGGSGTANRAGGGGGAGRSGTGGSGGSGVVIIRYKFQ